MPQKKILLLGGSGFVGHHLAMKLAARDYSITLPCRWPHRQSELKILSNLSLCQANIMDQSELTALCAGHDVIINLVGILNENRKNSFRRIHVDFVKSIVSACQTHKIRRLLHISALGADHARGSSHYLRSKGEGENLIHTFGQMDLEVTSFQPSVIFGHDDSFINRFAGILRLCMGVFPLACPQSRFSPVYIEDVVTVIADSIEDPGSHGKRYPLCGPETWTLHQIVKMINQALGTHCKIIGLPDSLARIQAGILQNLPGKLFTMDNYRSLQTPSTCDNHCEPCPTSLSHFIHGLASRYNPKSDLDNYRRQHQR